MVSITEKLHRSQGVLWHTFAIMKPPKFHSDTRPDWKGTCRLFLPGRGAACVAWARAAGYRQHVLSMENRGDRYDPFRDPSWKPARSSRAYGRSEEHTSEL